MADIGLRLSVWRPASLERTYLYGPQPYSLLDRSRLLEQIYSWDSGPYHPRGAATPQVATAIDQSLLEPFAQRHPPSKRSVRHFLHALSSLLDDPKLQPGTSWSDCEELVTTDAGEELNLRVNVTLSVLHHFLWVARIYADVPHASVLIR